MFSKLLGITLSGQEANKRLQARVVPRRVVHARSLQLDQRGGQAGAAGQQPLALLPLRAGQRKKPVATAQQLRAQMSFSALRSVAIEVE